MSKYRFFFFPHNLLCSLFKQWIGIMPLIFSGQSGVLFKNLHWRNSKSSPGTSSTSLKSLFPMKPVEALGSHPALCFWAKYPNYLSSWHRSRPGLGLCPKGKEGEGSFDIEYSPNSVIKALFTFWGINNQRRQLYKTSASGNRTQKWCNCFYLSIQNPKHSAIHNKIKHLKEKNTKTHM
jgi:hypothetical protein